MVNSLEGGPNHSKYLDSDTAMRIDELRGEVDSAALSRVEEQLDAIDAYGDSLDMLEQNDFIMAREPLILAAKRFTEEGDAENFKQAISTLNRAVKGINIDLDNLDAVATAVLGKEDEQPAGTQKITELTAKHAADVQKERAETQAVMEELRGRILENLDDAA